MPQLKVNKWIIVGLFLFAVLGFIDAAYITAEHYLGQTPPCTIFHNCEQVLDSSYAYILGLPVALYGALYYAAVIILLTAILTNQKYNLLKYFSYFTWAGIIFTGYFVFVMAFILKAYCIYCLGSAASSTLIFIFAQMAIIKQKQVA